MIISVSYKTDIPAFYGPWFARRLRSGSCKMVNPYGGQVYDVSLRRADVTGFVFWSRNYGPFMDPLEAVAGGGHAFICQMTITGYPPALDLATIAPPKAIAQIEQIARTWGSRAVVWRYDPVVISDLTPPDWHRKNFSALATALGGIVDEVVVSFAEMYQKTARNMAASARQHGFGWEDPDTAVKQELLLDLNDVAKAHNMRLTLCGQPALRTIGIAETACIDLDRLSDVAGQPLSAPRKAHRKDCGCWASKDTGAYDTCPHGCAYCYAVRNRDLAKARFKAHDPESPFLFAP